MSRLRWRDGRDIVDRVIDDQERKQAAERQRRCRARRLAQGARRENTLRLVEPTELPKIRKEPKLGFCLRVLEQIAGNLDESSAVRVAAIRVLLDVPDTREDETAELTDAEALERARAIVAALETKTG
jgi:hypothetical protein